jgi:acyl-coenzyme A synthetase/AMP-(fatty) acid ligase
VTAALFNACDYLPSFKRPRRIVFVTGYPTTATGKIRRVELRAQAATVLQGPAPADKVPL